MCKTPYSPHFGLSGYTHASSQAKENLGQAELLLAGRPAGRAGHSLNLAWPGGEQGLFHEVLPGSLGDACSKASLRACCPNVVILLQNLSREGKEELGGENDPCFQRVIFINKRISAISSPVLYSKIT